MPTKSNGNHKRAKLLFFFWMCVICGNPQILGNGCSVVPKISRNVNLMCLRLSPRH